MRPNLFDFATSELSQDAVLCWLLAWAKPSAQEADPLMAAVGRALLARLFHCHGRELPEPITSFEIRQQYRHIDILVIVNGNIAILVEDKVGTQDATAKLLKNVDRLEATGRLAQILPVYIQTREQSNYGPVAAAHYKPLRRRELIEVFAGHADARASNAIFDDFCAHLERVEADVQSFRHRALDQWSGLAWQGFYGAIKEALGGGDYGYVANASGGFHGLWWYWCGDKECQQYLQLEQRRAPDGALAKGALCFRILVIGQSINLATARSQWHSAILRAGASSDLRVIRPGRLGSGRSMSVAVVDQDYRVAGHDGLIDLPATVAVLRKAEAILDAAVRDEQRPSTEGNRQPGGGAG